MKKNIRARMNSTKTETVDKESFDDNIDAEGFMDTVKKIFGFGSKDKKPEKLKYTSDIVGTSIKDFTDSNSIFLTFEWAYNYIDDVGVKTKEDVAKYIDMMVNMSKELDELYTTNTKKVERRVIKDPTENFKDFASSITSFNQAKEVITETTDFFLKELIPAIEKKIKEPMKAEDKTKLINAIKSLASKLTRVMDALDKSIEVEKVDKEGFEERFYRSLESSVDAEKYNIGVYSALEIGDDSSNDVEEVVSMFGREVEKLKLVRTNIDDSKKLKIIKDLAPVYKAHKEYILSKKALLNDPNYKTYMKDIDDPTIGVERKTGGKILFDTVALWYSDWGEDIKINLIKMISPILKKYISFDLFLDETVGGDSYIYIVKKDGTVYDLVFDISHDGDSFSLRIVSFDVIEAIKSDIEMNS